MAPSDSSSPGRRASRHEDTGPVFVDASGRKLRLMRLVGGVALLLVAGYLVTIGIALLSGGPNAAAPFLPAASVPTGAPSKAPETPANPTGEATPGAGTEGSSSAAPLPAATSGPLTAANYVTPASPPAAGAAPAPAGAAPAAPAPTTAPTVAPAPSATPVSGQGTTAAPGQERRTIPTQPTHP